MMAERVQHVPELLVSQAQMKEEAKKKVACWPTEIFRREEASVRSKTRRKWRSGGASTRKE